MGKMFPPQQSKKSRVLGSGCDLRFVDVIFAFMFACSMLVGRSFGFGQDCNEMMFHPSNVTISEAGVIYVNNEPFFVRGIGYSPIPPGKRTMMESFDYFTDDYEYIWHRDLPLIRNMGANVLRLWNWDSTMNHQKFLDYAYSLGLMVLVPFLMTTEDYPDLTDPVVIRQSLMDWSQFVMKVKDHPAVFGYLIGNELDRAYTDQIDALFSVVNQMVEAKNYIEINMSGANTQPRVPHPATLPLSAVNFGFYVNKYYPWLEIDFWALQYYQDSFNGIIKEYAQTVAGWQRNSSTIMPKPLVFTEFGVDALSKQINYHPGQIVPYDPMAQATTLCNWWAEIAANGWAVTGGGSIMEWADEWWKGGFADVRHLLCPNQRTDVHSNCSIDVAANETSTFGFLYEEWLGLFEQGSINEQDSRRKFCIRARPAYCLLADQWVGFNSSKPSTGTPSNATCSNPPLTCSTTKFDDPYVTWSEDGAWVCANRRSVWLYGHVVYAYPLLLSFGVIIAAFFLDSSWLGKLIRGQKVARDDESEEGNENDDNGNGHDDAKETDPLKGKLPSGAGMSMASGMDEHGAEQREVPFVSTTCPEGVLLSQEITAAFKRYCYGDRFFPAAQERVFTMIYDRMVMYDAVLAREEETQDLPPEVSKMTAKAIAIRTVFEQYMEGYYLYINDDMPVQPYPNTNDLDSAEWRECVDNMQRLLEILALYTIVQQWACTINHAPEKVAEVFAFTKGYADTYINGDQNQNQPNAPESVATMNAVQELHHGLVEIFRVYYLKVDNNEASYDDINQDALYIKRMKLGYLVPGDEELEGALQRARNDMANVPASPATSRPASPVGGNADNRNAKRPSSLHQMMQTFASSVQYPEDILLPDSDHTPLKYHMFDEPHRKCKTQMAQRYFYSRGQDEGPYEFRQRFPQKGGMLTVTFNYGWVVRMLFWTWMFAWYAQPAYYQSKLCLSDTMLYLGVGDSVWKFITTLMHRRVLGRWTPRIIIDLVIYLPSALIMLAIAAYKLVPSPNLPAAFTNLLNRHIIAPSDAPIKSISFVEGYIGLQIIIGLVEEGFKFCRGTPPYADNPGREKTRAKVVAGVRRVFFIGSIAFISGLIGALYPLSGNVSKLATMLIFWPTMLSDLWLPFCIIAGFSAALLLSYLWGRSTVSKKDMHKLWIEQEVQYLFQNTIFWSLWVTGNFFAQYGLIIPAVIRIRFDICNCHPNLPALDMQDAQLCVMTNKLACFLGVVFLWFSTALVTFAVTYGVFQILLCFFGMFRGKVRRVGNVQNWQQADSHFLHITERCLPRVSRCFENGHTPAAEQNRENYWNAFIMELFDEHLLSESEMKRLSYKYKVVAPPDNAGGLVNPPSIMGQPGIPQAPSLSNLSATPRDTPRNKSQELPKAPSKMPPDFTQPPRSEEAKRRIITWLWSLEVLYSHHRRGEHTEMYAANRVFTMPSLTVLVPAYNETVIFTEDALKKTRTQKKNRISELEYLANIYWDEWENFAERVKPTDNAWVIDQDNFASELLEGFLGTSKAGLKSETVLQVRMWASLRGQTLHRTLAGLINCRKGLVQLATMEHTTWLPEQIEELVTRKYQIVLAHQTYNSAVDITKVENSQEEQIQVLFKKYKHFDIVYDDPKSFRSWRLRLKEAVRFAANNTELVEAELPVPPATPVTPSTSAPSGGAFSGQSTSSAAASTVSKGGNAQSPTNAAGKGDQGVAKKKKRRYYNYFHKTADFEQTSIQRVGRLKIGEGKAENQIHALAFAKHTVIQAMDMNQYFTFENGHKVPFVLHDYFGIAPSTFVSDTDWEIEDILPRVRLLGFPEWTYTRPLGIVGELMGCAEFCFVTIFHRVMNWPLRQRLHYGHPDMFDGFWVRNRGGSSKASRLVNTNEDIFAGYEMTGRGEPIDYVEFFDAQKGRESAFSGAFQFEAKLAQGGAQQCRSWDVYILNQKLDFMMKLSLFYSSLAFYVTNLIMTVSIDYYMLAIVLYALSGVTYHELGLMEAVISVPWLFQVGYIMAFPMFCELIVQKGFFTGLKEFIFTLPPSLIFFVFHLRTKTYFFSQGLLLGKGGYQGTGRGFGLERQSIVHLYRTYADSHLHQAILILLLLILYAAFSKDPFLPYLARCFTIILIYISWMWAPIIFNPMPTFEDMYEDVNEFMSWLSCSFKRVKAEKELMMKARLGMLLEKLRNELRQSGESTPFVTVEAEFWNNDTEQKYYAEVVKDATANVIKHKKLDEQSWMAWIFKESLIKNWDLEDKNFPRSFTLLIQKMILMFEAFLPWIFIPLWFWALDSVFYLGLVLCSGFFFWIVDKALAQRHDVQLMVKSLIVLALIPSYQFLVHDESMFFHNLIWSGVLYFIGFWIICDVVVGVFNMRAKFKSIGLFRSKRIKEEDGEEQDPRTVADIEAGKDGLAADPPTPGAVQKPDKSVRDVCAEDETKFKLFMYRLRVPRRFISVRKLLPGICLVLLVVGNCLCVLFSDILTSILFNSRVAEAWKKVYLRPVAGAPDNDDFGGAKSRIQYTVTNTTSTRPMRPRGGGASAPRRAAGPASYGATDNTTPLSASVPTRRRGVGPGSM